MLLYSRTLLMVLLFVWGSGLSVFGLFGSDSGAASDTFPRVVAKSQYLDLFDSKVPYTWAELLDLSLDVSGVAKEKFPLYRRQVGFYIHDLQKLLPSLTNDYDKGEEILRYMHRFLTRYEALQTSMDVLLDHGTYNCVSSALLYAVLARAMGLNASGVGTYDHVFINVALSDGQYIDVETTSQYGFDPGKSKEFVDTFTSTTGFVYVPKKAYKKRENLLDREFISLILQNRLYILNQHSRGYRVLEQMIPIAADLATLTQSQRDIQNFFSMVSQYSFSMSESGLVGKALTFTDFVLLTYGQRDSLLKVRNVIAFNSVFSLIDQGSYPQATAQLADYRKRGILDSDNDIKLLNMLKKKQLETLINSKSVGFDKKLGALQEIATKNLLSNNKLEELYQFIYRSEVYLLLKDNKFDQAVKTLNHYPLKLKGSIFYQNMLESMEDIYVVNIYNQSTSKINVGDLSEAQAILTEGLDFYPDNMRLLQLRSKLLKMNTKLASAKKS